MTTTRVRFAPSPTGGLHLGSLLAAFANVAFARAQGGTLVLRIDDTDRERSTLEHERDLLALLEQLGIAWDEGPFRQSAREDRYAELLQA